jgi:hypothetical protein
MIVYVHIAPILWQVLYPIYAMCVPNKKECSIEINSGKFNIRELAVGKLFVPNIRFCELLVSCLGTPTHAHSYESQY